MTVATKLFSIALFGASAGCESPVPDPPPAASPGDIALAAPRALGAMAAGTDGAPVPNAVTTVDPRSGPELVPDPDTGVGGDTAAPGVEAVPL